MSIPEAPNAVVEVAHATGVKTVLVKPVTQNMKVRAWSIFSDGGSAGGQNGAWFQNFKSDVKGSLSLIRGVTYDVRAGEDVAWQLDTSQ
jgi:hypothetical protein